MFVDQPNNKLNILEAVLKASNLCLDEIKAFLTVNCHNNGGNVKVRDGVVLVNEKTGRLEKLLPIDFKQFQGKKTVRFKSFDEAVCNKSFYF